MRNPIQTTPSLLVLALVVAACDRPARPYDADVVLSDLIQVSQQNILDHGGPDGLIINDRGVFEVRLDVHGKLKAVNAKDFKLHDAEDKAFPLQVSQQEHVSARDGKTHTLVTIRSTQPFLKPTEAGTPLTLSIPALETADGLKRSLPLSHSVYLGKAEVILEQSSLKLVTTGSRPELQVTFTNPGTSGVDGFVVYGSCNKDTQIARFYQSMLDLPAKGTATVNLQFHSGERQISSFASCNVWGYGPGKTIAIE